MIGCLYTPRLRVASRIFRAPARKRSLTPQFLYSAVNTERVPAKVNLVKKKVPYSLDYWRQGLCVCLLFFENDSADMLEVLAGRKEAL